MRTVGVLGREWESEVNRLRVQEYGRASGFQVAPHVLHWNQADDESTILGAFADGALISTMRLELISDLALLEAKLECPWTYGPLPFPVALLSKAATDSRYRGEGLNSALRYWSLHWALRWGVSHMVGTFVAGSPRERLLRALGYELLENPLGWNRWDYRSEKPVWVAKLDLQLSGRRALGELDRLVDGVESHYPWQGASPEPRMVTRVK